MISLENQMHRYLELWDFLDRLHHKCQIEERRIIVGKLKMRITNVIGPIDCTLSVNNT
jgi:hypothetical protein